MSVVVSSTLIARRNICDRKLLVATFHVTWISEIDVFVPKMGTTGQSKPNTVVSYFVGLANQPTSPSNVYHEDDSISNVKVCTCGLPRLLDFYNKP